MNNKKAVSYRPSAFGMKHAAACGFAIFPLPAACPTPQARRPRGFTLLEVIVVIGIVVLLTALTVTVAVGVSRRSEIRSTENVLTLLDLAMTEWNREADRQVTWGYNDPGGHIYFDLYNDTPQAVGSTDGANMLSIVLNKLNKHPASQSILRQIDGKYLKEVQDSGDPAETHLEIRDAWDNDIYVIHPGRIADPRTYGVDRGIFTDEDGTIRVSHTSIDSVRSHPAVENVNQAWEGVLGVCKNRRICFVSAGPDGDIGNISDDPADDNGDFDDTLDNIYSYPVGKP